ncbi:MAG: hypothetical protein RI897_1005 [Verrucomicrobiota bacterium]
MSGMGGLGQLEAWLGVECGLEVGPIDLIHFCECVEVDGDLFVGVLIEERFDGGVEFVVVDLFGEVIDGAVFMFDTELIEEVAEDGGFAFHEPAADEGGGGEVHSGAAEHIDHILMAVDLGFALQEDGADFTGFCDGREGAFVEILIVGEGGFDDFIRQLGRHETE